MSLVKCSEEHLSLIYFFDMLLPVNSLKCQAVLLVVASIKGLRNGLGYYQEGKQRLKILLFYDDMRVLYWHSYVR